MNNTTLEKPLPRHIAIIMDGNRRWACDSGLPRVDGHKEGLKAVKTIVKTCAEIGIKVLSLFAFSSENWQRSDDEVNTLLSLFVQALQNEVHELHEKSLRLRFIGDRSAFSQELQACIEAAEELTCHNQGMQLVLAMNYSGQWDILQAAKKLAEQMLAGKKPLSDIQGADFESYLSTHDLIPPDLFIRTSGEKRISNFFLWQIAYTELFFCEENWPNFGKESLVKAIDWYMHRERRYGK